MTLRLQAEHLEDKPAACLADLQTAVQTGQPVDFSELPCQRNWGAGYVGSLAMLVGRLERRPTSPFYGSNTELDDDLGVQLLDVGLKLGADPRLSDRLGVEPLSLVLPGLATSRRDNDGFCRRLAAEIVANACVRKVLDGVLGC